METALKHARFLQNESCKQIMSKYNKPFLTESEYQNEIGKFSEIAGAYHGIVKQLRKSNK